MQLETYGDVLRVTIQSDKHDHVWYAETTPPLRKDQMKSLWLWEMSPLRIEASYVYPAYHAASMTLAGQGAIGYEKRVDLLQQPLSLFEPPYLRDITLRELQVCEILRQTRHPNVCFYQGVFISQGFVTGLLFGRYDMTLREYLYEGHTIDIPQCIQNIRDGIQYIHSHGLVHCDTKPDNIFVHLQSQRFIVSDFDSVHHEGAHLSLKAGTVGWVPEDEDTDEIARYQIDWYSLEMVQAWLLKKMAFGRNPNDESEERYWTTNILIGAREKVLHGGIPNNTAAESTGRKDEEDEMDTSW
jgi:serine/threonine protein kinase